MIANIITLNACGEPKEDEDRQTTQTREATKGSCRSDEPICALVCWNNAQESRSNREVARAAAERRADARGILKQVIGTSTIYILTVVLTAPAYILNKEKL